VRRVERPLCGDGVQIGGDAVGLVSEAREFVKQMVALTVSDARGDAGEVGLPGK